VAAPACANPSPSFPYACRLERDDAALGYDAVVKQIVCVCRCVVEGEDDDRLWEKAQDHLGTDHPNLLGKVSREDILAQAEGT